MMKNLELPFDFSQKKMIQLDHLRLLWMQNSPLFFCFCPYACILTSWSLICFFCLVPHVVKWSPVGDQYLIGYRGSVVLHDVEVCPNHVYDVHTHHSIHVQTGQVNMEIDIGHAAPINCVIFLQVSLIGQSLLSTLTLYMCICVSVHIITSVSSTCTYFLLCVCVGQCNCSWLWVTGHFDILNFEWRTVDC